MDDYRLLGNIYTLPHPDGYDGTLRSCETGNKIYPLECNKADMIIQVIMHTIVAAI